MYLHFIYADSIPVICENIKQIIIITGIMIFLYKMFSLFTLIINESDVTYKDRPSNSYIWKIETKEPENKENNNGSIED